MSNKTGLVGLVLSKNAFLIGNADGILDTYTNVNDLYKACQNRAVLMCNRPLIRSHLRSYMPQESLDILELFAFVCPAVPTVPTIKEIASYLKIDIQNDKNNEGYELKLLYKIVRKLFMILNSLSDEEKIKKASLANVMLKGARWNWGNDVLNALGVQKESLKQSILNSFSVWNELAEIPEILPVEPPGTQEVSEKEAEDKLKELLLKANRKEERLDQIEFAKTASKTFDTRQDYGYPSSVLIQAGTGIGKTLGYLAPVSVWCEKNAGTVWISTYTKNLQRQLDNELNAVYPDADKKKQNVVIRKGRENYLCLLNFAEIIAKIERESALTLPLGLIAEWIRHTKDGDLSGGDFPGWLTDLVSASLLKDLANKRGECLYAQCPHYKKCFVEKIIRQSKQAKVVVVNHALAMSQLANLDEDNFLPVRYVFDEGHHIFNVADDVFSAAINCQEGIEVRRAIIGNDGSKLTRNRGLRKKLEDLVVADEEIAKALDDVILRSSFLPKENALSRIKNRTPQGHFEEYLMQVYRQVQAKKSDFEDLYSIECETRPTLEVVLTASDILKIDVLELKEKVICLIANIENYLDKNIAKLETSEKQRYYSTIKSLQARVLEKLTIWHAMLKEIKTKTPKEMIDWFEITKTEGFEYDVGYYRHWIDPTFPFAQVLGQIAHGALITSATLKDKSNNDDLNWDMALKQTGFIHFEKENRPSPIIKRDYISPFDYKKNTRILVVTDVDKRDVRQVAAAYRELFLASKGGALGIFTAIKRLKDVYQQIYEPLGNSGLSLYAQHVDAVMMQTLLDVFKADENSCLLGTDAVRDGIDVPGNSLRMIVFDRVPWNRPNIAYKARKNYYEDTENRYDYIQVRMKLAQAFGRLIRKKDDRGVFVIMDRALPSETLSAFPEGVEVQRLGFKDAISQIKEFFLNLDI